MRQRTFTGFLAIGEVFADNTDNYRQILEQEDPYSDKYERALRELEHFPPGVPHDLLVAHKVNVYEIIRPWWQNIRGMLVPSGRLSKVFSADLGEMLKNARADENDFISIGLTSERGMRRYSAIIGSVQITPEKPLEFHFRQYVKIDDAEIRDGSPTHIARPMFSRNYEKALQFPDKLLEFHYSRTRARIWGE